MEGNGERSCSGKQLGGEAFSAGSATISSQAIDHDASRDLGNSLPSPRYSVLNQSQRPYEFLTNCSGLPERSFAMVGPVGPSFRAPRDMLGRRWVSCGCHDSRDFHNDWFSELLVFALCAGASQAPPAMQARKLITKSTGTSVSFILGAKKDPRRERCL